MQKLKFIATAVLAAGLLLSCSVLRKKDKTKTILQLDSSRIQASTKSLIDTSSAQSYQRITLHIPKGYFKGESQPQSRPMAKNIMDAAANLDSKPDLQGAFMQGQDGITATIETWTNEKKGIHQDEQQRQETDVKKQEKTVDTTTTSKRPSVYPAIGIFLATLFIIYLVYRYIKNRI